MTDWNEDWLTQSQPDETLDEFVGRRTVEAEQYETDLYWRKAGEAAESMLKPEQREVRLRARSVFLGSQNTAFGSAAMFNQDGPRLSGHVLWPVSAESAWQLRNKGF